MEDEDRLKLTRVERIILANQHRILAALEPKDKDHHEQVIEALENGYELQYEWFFEHVYRDDQGLSLDQCREVVAILAMHDALAFEQQKLGSIPGVDWDRLLPVGFDGNDSVECRYMAYARYYCGLRGGLFKSITKRMDGFNSHCPSLRLHRARLEAFNASADSHHLTAEDVLRIYNARG